MSPEVPQSSDQIVVTDRRQKFDSDAETHPVQEGAPVESIDCGPALPDAPVEEPTKAEEPAKGPMKFPTLYIPSLIPGARSVEYTVSELLPWKGVFWMVVDVKDKPQPHIVLVPMEHTKAHKKIAQKAQRAALTPRKKRIGGAPKLVLVPPTTPTVS